MNFKKLLDEISLNPRRLFLIDSLGALLSTLLYLFVLAKMVGVFGMPQKVIYPLAVLAGVYTIYSGLCYWLKPKNWRPFLKVIALANLLHCGLTFCLLFIYQQELTALGVVYFLGEIIIVVCLAIIELRVASEKGVQEFNR